MLLLAVPFGNALWLRAIERFSPFGYVLLLVLPGNLIKQAGFVSAFGAPEVLLAMGAACHPCGVRFTFGAPAIEGMGDTLARILQYTLCKESLSLRDTLAWEQSLKAGSRKSWLMRKCVDRSVLCARSRYPYGIRLCVGRGVRVGSGK
ncbi:hypothetical protein FHR92_002392 [Fontibacillus solani]|uniref:Uncharacterized protein n=1 Tax=Fontibacillus solani TaxID=1572857 RepID=A0A7W3STE8_9BACL|nr:hypothetical protein [Fontibacillus solani]MBA9085920.1 hypothetical protein [Fontibacillus solani]